MQKMLGEVLGLEIFEEAIANIILPNFIKTYFTLIITTFQSFTVNLTVVDNSMRLPLR